jgi:hypothetical protein
MQKQLKSIPGVIEVKLPISAPAKYFSVSWLARTLSGSSISNLEIVQFFEWNNGKVNFKKQLTQRFKNIRYEVVCQIVSVFR